jgi:hypothetical protein
MSTAAQVRSAGICMAGLDEHMEFHECLEACAGVLHLLFASRFWLIATEVLRRAESGIA